VRGEKRERKVKVEVKVEENVRLDDVRRRRSDEKSICGRRRNRKGHNSGAIDFESFPSYNSHALEIGEGKREWKIGNRRGYPAPL
jgi:hypothetical protein